MHTFFSISQTIAKRNFVLDVKSDGPKSGDAQNLLQPKKGEKSLISTLTAFFTANIAQFSGPGKGYKLYLKYQHFNKFRFFILSSHAFLNQRDFPFGCPPSPIYHLLMAKQKLSPSRRIFQYGIFTNYSSKYYPGADGIFAYLQFRPFDSGSPAV
jgi:hypothetical protein